MTKITIHTPQRIIPVNGIDICTDAFGDKSDPAMLLINGQGGQFIMWDKPFCEQLAAQGYYVIRYDHRDVGLSTHLDHLPLPEMSEVFGAWLSGQEYDPIPDPPYTLWDMVEDTTGLLDALEIDQAHLFGISMGGMIAQMIAFKYPERVRSLILYATSPGKPGLKPPTPEAVAALAKPAIESMEERIEQGVESAHVMGGGIYPLDEDRARRRLKASYDRSYDPTGAARQLAAAFGTPPQFHQLPKLTMPTLVLHGDQDPLIPLSYGEYLAEHIPGAKLHILKDIGHAMPPGIWDEIIEAIANHAKQNPLSY